MKARCTIPSSTGWAKYGGKGIKVCARWLGPNGFKNFLEDMGERPTPIHSIERIHGDKDYSPDNCCWATPLEQADNSRGPSPRTLEIASALASGATSNDIVTIYNISPERVRQIREKYVGEGRVGRPRTVAYTHQTIAGRDLLTKFVGVAESSGWDPGDLLEWVSGNVPKKQ